MTFTGREMLSSCLSQPFKNASPFLAQARWAGLSWLCGGVACPLSHPCLSSDPAVLRLLNAREAARLLSFTGLKSI